MRTPLNRSTPRPPYMHHPHIQPKPTTPHNPHHLNQTNPTPKQVRLVFSNALEYNTSAEHPVRVAAEALAGLFEERFGMLYRPYLQQLEEERVKKVG